MNILIRTLQVSYLVLTYLCFYMNIIYVRARMKRCQIFGIQGKAIVCFFSALLLLLSLLLTLRVSFSKLLIIFCNVFRSGSFLRNISVRYSISAFKYFSGQILVTLARNPLNMLVVVSEGIQECDLICTFVRAGLG